MSTPKRRAASKPRKTKAAKVGHGHEEGPVSIAEAEGVLVAREPWLFRHGHEAFGRRLAAAIGRRDGVRSVRVCLASGTCRVEFEPGLADASAMADRFAESVREAIAPDPHDDPARDGGWSALTVFPAGEASSCWETTREGIGALRLRNPILRHDLDLARRVARELADATGVGSCRASIWRRDLEVRFDPAATTAEAVVSAAEDAFRRALRPELDRSTVEAPGTPAVASGPRRAWNLALAGGSFAMTVVGLVVPGVPTAPFLLATSYYLARSSPRLHGLLLRSRFFGPILAELEEWGGLRRLSKLKLIALTLAVGALTLVLVGPPLAMLLVMLAVASAGVYVIARMPGIPTRARGALPTAT